MPQVDFTLEDVRQMMYEAIDERTPVIVKGIVEQALVQEREHTRQMMADEFMSFWDHNLGPVLDDLQDDVKVIKDIVKDHSFRIARLEARSKPS